jgi:hypothetical protein
MTMNKAIIIMTALAIVYVLGISGLQYLASLDSMKIDVAAAAISLISMSLISS